MSIIHFNPARRVAHSQRIATGGIPPSSRLPRFEKIRNIFQSWIARQSDVSDLRNVMETNDYHRSSVWHHTQRVAQEGERLLELDFITSPRIKERLQKHLDEVIDPNSENQYTRAELVFAAMFLHDIGKGMRHPKGKVSKASFSVFGEQSRQMWKTLTFADCIDARGKITPAFVEQSGKLKQLFESVLNQENRIFEILKEALAASSKTKHKNTLFAEFGEAQDLIWNIALEARCFFSKKGIINPDFENKRELFRQMLNLVLENEKTVFSILELGQNIGEPVIRKDETGKTSALAHAAVGAPMAAKIAMQKNGLNHTEVEAKYIEFMVENHMGGFTLEDEIKAKEGKQSPQDIIASFFNKVGQDPLIILHAMADVSGSDFDSSAVINRHIGIINTRYTLQRKRLSLALDSAIDTLDALAKDYGVFLVPGHFNIEKRIKELVEAQLAPRIAAGKIKPDKVPSIVANRVKKLMGKFQFRATQANADTVEHNFDFADLALLQKKPIILEISLG